MDDTKRKVFFLSLLLPCCAISTFQDPKQASFVASLKEYHIVTPRKVTANGDFISHRLHHTYQSLFRRRRDLSDRNPSSDTLHYKLSVKNMDLHLRLKPNDHLIAPNAVIERRKHRYKNVSDSDIRTVSQSQCHYIGDIKGHAQSSVAISTCGGLTGLLRTEKVDYFIEPVKGDNITEGHRHILYSHAAIAGKNLPKSPEKEKPLCGVEEDKEDEEQRDRWERHRQKHPSSQHHRERRSTSKDRYVETLVVLDPTMTAYYKNDEIDLYILTVMNMVAGIFHEASLGNAVHVSIVRIVQLATDEPGLRVSHHADHTLNSFCRWQKTINPQVNHKNHHDVAILVTRKNICSRMNEPCSTLGLAQVNGMCQDHRSCNINEDTGLNLAFTIAHELGHNFGMRHDTVENNCVASDAPFHQLIMAAQLYLEAFPVRWSNCSRKAITRFLDRGWGYCLDNEPDPNEEFEQYQKYSYVPPGVIYDADHQCRLQYNHNASYCSGIDDSNVCTTLWCQTDSRCLTRLEAAAEGTSCGEHKWCFNGQCVEVGERPEAINGEWGEWTGWTECTWPCGGGVSHNERHCDNPMPQNGGKYCLGLRRRYRTCNTHPCPPGTPGFREQQCSEFNYLPIRNGLHRWIPVLTPKTPCQLHCRPRNKYFSLMLKEVVTDGTPCRRGTKDMCIHGICTKVGCDWEINSKAKEDRCGVCQGNGLTCQEVKDKFDLELGQGYVEAQLIPEGARNIRVEEVAAATNYLAIRNKKGQYYLNGHWFINWSGDYPVAGTTVHYKRHDNKESFSAPGPLNEDIQVMVLFQSQNPGVKFKYTVPKENITVGREPEFHWEYSDWSKCTTSCGGGIQAKIVTCVEKEAGLVEDKYCNHDTRKDDIYRSCNDQDCPPRWHTYPWQSCSVTCGKNGTRRRTILCIQHRRGFEEALDDLSCAGLPKPAGIKPCKPKAPCPGAGHWITGNWSDTCGSDPCAVQDRLVQCSDTENRCDKKAKPASQRQCDSKTCGTWQVGPWSKCTRTCGGGIKFRTVTCSKGLVCDKAKRLPKEQLCNSFACVTSKPASKSDEKSFNEVNKAIKEKTAEDMVNNLKATQAEGRVTVTNEPLVVLTNGSISPSSVTAATPSAVSNKGQSAIFSKQTVNKHESKHYTDKANTSALAINSTSRDQSNRFDSSGNNGASQPATTVQSYAAHSFSSSGWFSKFISRFTTFKMQPTEASSMVARSSDSIINKTNKYIARNGNPSTTKSVQKQERGSSLLKSATTAKPPESQSNSVFIGPDPISIDIPDPVELYGNHIIKQAKQLEPEKDSKANEEESNSVEGTQTNSGKFGNEIVAKPSITKQPVTVPSVILHESPTSQAKVDDKQAYEWKLTDGWSKCSRPCGGGKQEQVQYCVSIGSGQEQDSSFCEGLVKHSASRPCNQQTCLQWEVMKWSPCSVSCGLGIKRRDIICPRPDMCDPVEKPNNTVACHLPDCLIWVAGDWGECSKSCGGGEQTRPVKCINETSLEPTTGCKNDTEPVSSRSCNSDLCPQQRNIGLDNYKCHGDVMATDVCKMMRRLCTERFFQRKCCYTCQRQLSKHRDRAKSS